MTQRVPKSARRHSHDPRVTAPLVLDSTYAPWMDQVPQVYYPECTSMQNVTACFKAWYVDSVLGISTPIEYLPVTQAWRIYSEASLVSIGVVVGRSTRFRFSEEGLLYIDFNVVITNFSGYLYVPGLTTALRDANGFWCTGCVCVKPSA